MNTRKLLLITAVAALVAPATASADFIHVVAPGESLSSVAAIDGLSLSQLAAANGLSTDSTLISGGTLQIPPQTGDAGGAADSSSSSSSSGSEASSAALASGASSAPASGGYVVQPGDTLSAIAAQYGTSIDALASVNGLDPAGILPAGATISISGAPVSSETSSAPVASSADSSSSNSTGSSSSSDSAGSSGAQPTPESVSAGDVGSIAEQNGVSPSLAEAIGYQESGFNNDLVSSTGATGVMQIEPGTWDYIGKTLVTPPPLSPDSATDNVRGGVLLLRSLLDQTGGDPAMAAAGYYQGLQSVQQNGMYSDTQQYVNNVMALRQRFGGG
jgi:N-acetylmuramoyl-L-alanine amidase